MAKGQEAVDFQQLHCKKLKIDSIFHTKGQSQNVVNFQNAHMVALFDQGNRLMK